MDFNPARKELKAANSSIKGMQEARSYETYEQQWRNFLNHLEKSFEKLKIACAPKIGKFNNFAATEISLRSRDQLLVYLKQARNADNHSIADVSKKSPGSFSINPATGNSLTLDLLTISDGKVTILSSKDLKIDIIPDSIEVITITNRGVAYPPPTSHLNEKIDTKLPDALAEKGIAFYITLIDKVEKELR